MNREQLEAELEALDAEVQKQEQEEQGSEVEHWRQLGERVAEQGITDLSGVTIELVVKDGKSTVRYYGEGC